MSASFGAALLFVAGITSAGVRAEGELAARLDAALEVKALRGAHVGVLVVSRETGALRYQRSPRAPLAPASNQKILTSLAALDVFGPTHRFLTEVRADRPIDSEGAVGTLYLRGGGDPTLTSEQWWRLAADLRMAGLRRIQGDLVLDDSRFDRIRWHPAWGETGSRAYHAPIGALSANYGAFTVTVVPSGHAGGATTVRVDPPVEYLQVVNRARTGPPGSPSTLVVDRVAAGEKEEIRIRGRIPAGSPATSVFRSVLDPARYAGAVFRLQLEANGIRVDGATHLGPVPEPAAEILVFEGRPLAEIVRLFVKYSNNSVAESLVKLMAWQSDQTAGSWAKGLPILRTRLGDLGLDLTGLKLIDGSGLAHANRVTPRLLVDALRLAAGSFDLGPEFVVSLPIAGSDGTLKRRAHAAAGRIRAKTGLLDRVTALSGFAETRTGESLVFSILVNGYRSSDEAAMAAVDGFVAALVGPQDTR